MKKISLLFLLLTFNSTAAEVQTSGVIHHLSQEELLIATEINLDLPKGILKAISKVESNHNNKAFVKHDGSSAHASYGLLQIQLASARQMGFKGKPKDLLKPEVNIKYGGAYLKWLLDLTRNDYAKALTCYNAGPYSKQCRSKKYSSYVGLILNAWINQDE